MKPHSRDPSLKEIPVEYHRYGENLKFLWTSQGITFKLMSLISIAIADSNGIGVTPVGRGASAILSAVILSTSSVRWVSKVHWSCPNTRKYF